MITTSPSGGGTPTSITNGGGTVSVGLDGSIAITAAAAKNVTLTGTAFALEADVSDPNTLTTTAVLGHRFWVGGTGVEVDTLDILPAGITVLGKALLFGGSFTTSGASALTLTTTGATNVTLPTSGTLATQAYVDTAVLGLLDFKGSQDCSANPNYPSALKGDVYMVSVAGKIGGASGTTVEAGDLFTASADNAGGTQASVGASWVVTQANVVLGTNVATALAIAVGSAGAIVVNGGVLGTPSSGTLTNCTGLPNASVTGLGALATITPGTGVATFATTPSSANLLAALTDKTGTGSNVFATSPTLVTPILGTPTSGNLANCTALPAAGVTGTAVTQTTLSNASLPASFTTLAASGASSFATAGGNIAIGNATPSYLLHARKDVAGSADIVVENQTATGQATLRARNNSGVDFQAGVAGGSYSTYQNLTANSVFFYTAATGGMGFNIDNATAGFSFWTNGAARVTISNAGVLGVSSSVSSAGDLISSTAGKGLQLKSGTGARAGNATLSGGTLTVTNTTVTANTIIVGWVKTAAGTLGTLSYTLSASTSFTITSSSAIDTSVISFLLLELN